MIKSKINYCLLILLFSSLAFTSAQSTFANSVNNIQYTNPTVQSIYGSGQTSFWPDINTEFDESMCGQEGTDFILMIPPLGCEPMVVRSDLLAEQNVPVMCQLTSLRVNPLVRVSSIKSIGFSGKNPPEVAGVSYYPARAGIRSYNTLLGDPVHNNVGYVNIILKKNPDESTMPKFVEGNLTARVSYDAEKAFGVGNAILYLDEDDGSETSSFWGGLGYIKLISIDPTGAKVAVYDKSDKLIRQVSLKQGETSSKIYLPGFYCQASLRLRLADITYPEDSALLNIDGSLIWVRKGSTILNGRCTVYDLDLYTGQTGKITLSCSGAGRIELDLIETHSAKISFGSSSELFNVSNLVFKGGINEGTKLNWYLAHTGNIDNSDSFIVLLGSPDKLKPNVYSELAAKINTIQDKASKNPHMNILDEIKKITLRGFNSRTNMIILGRGEGKSLIGSSKGTQLTFDELVETASISDDTEKKSIEVDPSIVPYLNEADKAVKELLDSYPQVRGDLNRFAEIALLEQINLVSEHGEKVDALNLMEVFLEKYPDSVYASSVRDMYYPEKSFNSQNARTTFEINGNFYSIILNRFKPVDDSSKNAVIYLGSERLGSAEEGGELNIDSSQNNKLRISKIYPNRVDVEFLSKGSSNQIRDKFTLRLNEPQTRKIDSVEYIFQASDINVRAVAKVEILGDINKKTSEANFTYKIGIEQRTIKLNPNKSSEKAEKLNKTIQKLEEKNRKLGELIKGWKGACLATGLALNIKNFVTGYSGESLARQEVMRAWKPVCSADTTPTTLGTPRSTDACYNAFSSDIEKDVKAYATAIESINREINAKNNVTEFIKGLGKTDIQDLDGGARLNTADLRSWEDVRAYLLYEKLKGDGTVSPTLRSQIKTDRNSKLQYLVSLKDERTRSDSNSMYGISFDSGASQENKQIRTWSKERFNSINEEKIKTGISNLDETIANTNPAIRGEQITENGNTRRFILVLDKVPTVSEGASVVNVFDVTNENSITLLEDPSLLSRFNNYDYREGECENEITRPIVTYYESGSAKGLAAMVPFDIKKGWYVKISNSEGGLASESARGYTSAAVPETFTICNVGSDHLQGIDDSCRTFSINHNLGKDTSQVNVAGCLISVRELDRLLADAQEALRQANRQYASKGNIKIAIRGRESFEASRGNPAVSDGPIEQCQDFMSPKDCQILFNVCDPVMCPSSRCNFGGKYQVSNVIQSGIVGSLTLCLPNFKLFGGDVYVPICLTGIHAGIDTYISILKAQRDCLDEHARTGKHTGMCDYVTAVYKCNLLWNQVAPFTSNILPSIYSWFSGKQKSGGGEYLTFQKSWNNMEASLDYFKNTYGKNSFTAFKLGDVQSFGSEVCNAYIGTSFPTTAEGLDKMLQPESPYQVYAEFQEVPHTDATVPPTSQYKVFAHIYAGKDQGVSYSVYLRSPPSSSYYSSIPQLRVPGTGTGYVQQGEQIQVSQDFTAPAGYKELCVSVNGKEHCNFGPVSTNFAANVLTDSYVKKQASQEEIRTEKECQQGTSGVIGFTSINPQAAVTNVADPRIDLKGIVRVCSSVNPGEGTAQKSNWKSVGYCGDTSITCWLDISSVREATGQIFEATGTVSAAESKLDLIDGGAILTEEDSISKIVSIKNSIAELSSNNLGTQIPLILSHISEVEEKGYSIRYMAEALYWKFKLYEQAAFTTLGRKSTVEKVQIRETGVSGTAEVTKAKTFGELKVKDTLVKGGVYYTVESITQDSDRAYIKFKIKGTEDIHPLSVLGSDKISSKGYSWSVTN